MIRRDLHDVLVQSAAYYPVVTLTGPRQSGKTTLCRAAFPQLSYASLEALDTRAYAREDPRGFLAEHRGGAILDEVQRVPELIPYLQEEVDREPAPGRFVLTGSQNLALTQAISQSLAGRTAVHELFPPSFAELLRFPHAPTELFDVLVAGAFPRIHDVGVPHRRWLADYIDTYVQRDVRQLLSVTDLTAFSTFVRLAAARTGTEVHLSALGADAGITHNTVRSWLSVLEASYLALRLPPWHTNARKQLIKSPKLHFTDSGLVCALLGIHTADHLRHHPLRGAVFESWVVAELAKQRAHAGQRGGLHHYRDARRLEVDLIVDEPPSLTLVEIKSGATVQRSWFAPMDRLHAALGGREVRKVLLYGGETSQHGSEHTVLGWREVGALGPG